MKRSHFSVETLRKRRNLLMLDIKLLLLLCIFLISNNLKANIKDIKIDPPEELTKHFNIEFLGAFKPLAKGESNSNYAIGTLAYNPKSESIFMAGHSRHNAVAEFKIPDNLSKYKDVKKIELAQVLQPYVKVLNRKTIGNKTDRITGMIYYNGRLLVNSEIWYDGSGKNKDNLLVFHDASNLAHSKTTGMLQIQGAAKAAGYMSYIPKNIHSALGGEYLTGWASNYSITSRYSQGPSLYIFDPETAVKADLTNRIIKTTAKMVFPFEGNKSMVPKSNAYGDNISPKWGPLANVRYGFIIPDTNLFLAVGFHGGIESGVGYKITQTNGYKCGGPCARDSEDTYNYYWLFNVEEIAEAREPHLVQPISYGKWHHPFDEEGKHSVIGATFDHLNSRLFISLSKAARIGKYDRPPLIIVYKIEKT